MTERQDQVLAKIEFYRDELREAQAAVKRARKGLHDWITKAVAADVPPAEVARLAGVSRARVTQIAPLNPITETTRDTVIHAQEKEAVASCVTLGDTVPSLPATLPDVSGVVTVRRRAKYGSATGGKTLWLDCPGRSVAWILNAASAHGADRVMLAGAPLFDLTTGATKAEAVRAWAMQDPGPGWTAGDHYLAYADLPILRFVHEDGRKIRVVRGATWWGETDADVATCQQAWEALERAIDSVPAFRGCGLADTPATTGRALWLRTIPEGRAFPVMSDELRELIGSTAGQGRIELLPYPGSDRLTGATAGGNGFTVMDGRLMYAALTWGMPVGEPRRWTGDELRQLDAREYERTLRGRGRWRITARVPDGWSNVGMLMAPEAGGGWIYPRTPGETFSTWADGSEVWLALTWGWDVETHEGITWDEGKALDTWRDALLGIWRSAAQSQAPAAKLGAKAVRHLIINTIGAFSTRAHPETHTAPIDSDPDVPPGTEVRVVGDKLVWETPGTLSSFTAETAHPEWSATVWARARTRLLDSRGVNGQRVGALHLDPSQIIGFHTDALYLAGPTPEWADDGKPGRFRVKGHLTGGFNWPGSFSDLWELSDRAEAAHV
jgi:hypothetical protein